jgi:hypothetical protein
MAVAYNRYKLVTVPLLERLCNGRFASETAIWIQKRFKNPLGLLEGSRYNSFSRRGQWAWL